MQMNVIKGVPEKSTYNKYMRLPNFKSLQGFQKVSIPSKTGRLFFLTTKIYRLNGIFDQKSIPH